MIRHLAAGMKHALGLHRPGRWLPVRPDDILLASYPKSGNTWLRFLIANLIHPDREIGLGNLHQLVLDPEVSVKRDFDRAPRPRFIKSHSSFDPRYRRVIYVVRDPRDVALSQYHHLRTLRRSDNEFPMEPFIGRFLTGELHHDPGSWGDNVGSWLAARSGHPGFLLLRPEDLLADPARELTRVAEFAGLPTTRERILQAIERSSANASMRSSWRNDLPESQVARIEAAWGDIMACLGYELVTRDSRAALNSSLIGLLAAGAADRTGERRKKIFAGDASGGPGSLAQMDHDSMMKRLINTTKRALGHTSQGRHFEVFDDDTFIVSFPKSGNTWTRFLIANLLHPGEPANFGNIDRLIPESEELTKNQLARVPRPRIMKSHEYFDARFRKVIYIVRDPRDVAVSQFHFFRKRRRIADDYSIEQFVTRFVAGETCDYSSWGGNVASWLVTRQNSPNFLLLRYEDMVARTAAELTRVASFLGSGATPELVAQAVERSSAEQMRKLEGANATATVTKNSRQDVPFVRAAKAGGWRTGLPESAVQQLEAAWGPLMVYLGYELMFPEKAAASDVRVPETILNGSSR